MEVPNSVVSSSGARAFVVVVTVLTEVFSVVFSDVAGVGVTVVVLIVVLIVDDSFEVVVLVVVVVVVSIVEPN